MIRGRSNLRLNDIHVTRSQPVTIPNSMCMAIVVSTIVKRITLHWVLYWRVLLNLCSSHSWNRSSNSSNSMSKESIWIVAKRSRIMRSYQKHFVITLVVNIKTQTQKIYWIESSYSLDSSFPPRVLALRPCVTKEAIWSVCSVSMSSHATLPMYRTNTSSGIRVGEDRIKQTGYAKKFHCLLPIPVLSWSSACN